MPEHQIAPSASRQIPSPSTSAQTIDSGGCRRPRCQMVAASHEPKRRHASARTRQAGPTALWRTTGRGLAVLPTSTPWQDLVLTQRSLTSPERFPETFHSIYPCFPGFSSSLRVPKTRPSLVGGFVHKFGSLQIGGVRLPWRGSRLAHALVARSAARPPLSQLSRHSAWESPSWA